MPSECVMSIFTAMQMTHGYAFKQREKKKTNKQKMP